MKHLLYTITLLFFLGFSQMTFGQIQVGQTILDSDTLREGQSNAISADGQRIIIGNHGYEGALGGSGSPGEYGGTAKVYDWNGTSWNQVGTTLKGVSYLSTNFAKSVDISDDGNRILVAANNEFHVYDWNGLSWNEVGNNPVIEMFYAFADIAMSGNGDYIVYGQAATYPLYEAKVKVYELNTNTWELKGDSISGFTINISCNEVSINSDGSIIAFGSHQNSSSDDVMVYEWSGGSWLQKGGTISTPPVINTTMFSSYVDLTTTGNRIVVAGQYAATVFDFDNGIWKRVGNHIFPEKISIYNRSIKEVKISGDGTVVAMGTDAAINEIGGLEFHKISDNNYWSQIVNKSLGDDIKDGFGSNINISENGSFTVTGSNDDYDHLYKDGYTKVIQIPANFCPWELDDNLNLRGSVANDKIGEVIANSEDGKFLAISTKFNDNLGTLKGQVRVFEDVNGQWVQRGTTLIGESAMDQFGSALDISDDGSILVVGAINNDDGGFNSGHVRVYLWDGSNYVQFGSDIDGVEANENFGSSVSISGNGLLLAVGSPGYDDSGTDNGKVQVYSIDHVSGILPYLNPIYGQNTGDRAGYCVILSANGKRLAVGSPNNDDNGSNSGEVRIYKKVNNVWSQLGSDISGEAAEDLSGGAISLNATGKIVAIGAAQNDGGGGIYDNSGHVRIYIYSNAHNKWALVGADIDGTYGDNLGASVDLSASGKRLVVGLSGSSAPYGFSSPTTFAGKVRVYDWEGSSWVQNGQDIYGQNSNGKAGASVKITGDGTKVFIGAPNCDKLIASGGSVRVFETCTSNTKSLSFETDEEEESISEEIINEDLMLYPNPVQNELQWKIKDVQIQKVQIFNMQGQVVLSKEVMEGTLNLEALVSGAYFIKLTSNHKVYQKKFIKK